MQHKQDRHNCTFMINFKLFLSDLSKWRIHITGQHVTPDLRWRPKPPDKQMLPETTKDKIISYARRATPSGEIHKILMKEKLAASRKRIGRYVSGLKKRKLEKNDQGQKENTSDLMQVTDSPTNHICIIVPSSNEVMPNSTQNVQIVGNDLANSSAVPLPQAGGDQVIPLEPQTTTEGAVIDLNQQQFFPNVIELTPVFVPSNVNPNDNLENSAYVTMTTSGLIAPVVADNGTIYSTNEVNPAQIVVGSQQISFDSNSNPVVISSGYLPTEANNIHIGNGDMNLLTSSVVSPPSEAIPMFVVQSQPPS